MTELPLSIAKQKEFICAILEALMSETENEDVWHRDTVSGSAQKVSPGGADQVRRYMMASCLSWDGYIVDQCLFADMRMYF